MVDIMIVVFDYIPVRSPPLYRPRLIIKIPYICSFSFQPIECDHESRSKHNRHGIRQSSLSFFERTRFSRSAPVLLLHHTNLTHHRRYVGIKHTVSAQTTAIFLPTLPSTAKNTMLVCQQTPPIILNDQTDKDSNSIFLTCPELAAFINNGNQTTLIIDCGSPLRHTERRIQDSFLLNVNDKISRKRLATRGLKNFLDANQFNRFEQNQLIILYDDSTRTPPCSNPSMQSQLSQSMKCIYDEVKRYDENKIIYVLQSSFNDFYQHYPSLCYISTSTDKDLPLPPPSPMAVNQADIDFCQISEILPGLYLGSSRDAEDLNVLKEHKIKTILNISTTLPCYFENENIFEYRRLPCHDSPRQDILQYFETTFEYIHQQLSANRNILIHCQAGISRSPSFIIGYLMRYDSKTFEEAYNFVQSKRNIVSPNLNFIGQLTRYQQMLTNA